MAHSSGYSNGSSAVLADRRRERMRRVELANQQDREEIPSFPSEPRRITAERQDSLTNRIEHVLGDINEVQRHLGNEPNIWLGTSRTGQNASRTQTLRNEGNSKAAHQSSRSKPQQNSSLFSPTHESKPHIPPKKCDESTQQNSFYSKYQSSNLTRHNNTADRINSPQMQDPNNYSQRNGITDQAHNRERLQSVDIPVAVENIFKEMLQMNEPLSEIQTPNIGQEFNFAKSETKSKDGTKESTPVRTEQGDNAAAMSSSDENSSDESDESDESDAEQEMSKWDLSVYLQEDTAPNESVPEQKLDSQKQKALDSSHQTPGRKLSNRGRPSERKSSVDSKARSSSSRSSSVKGKTDEKVCERSKSARSRSGTSQRSSPVRSQSQQRPGKTSSKTAQDIKRTSAKASPVIERKSPTPKPLKHNDQSANRNSNNSMPPLVSNESSTPSNQRHRTGQKYSSIRGRVPEKKQRGHSSSSDSSMDSSSSESEAEKSPERWSSFRERSNSSSSNKPCIPSKKTPSIKASTDRRSAPTAFKTDMDRRKPSKPDQSFSKPIPAQVSTKQKRQRSNESTPVPGLQREGSVVKQPQSRSKTKKSSKQHHNVSVPLTNEPNPSGFPSLWVSILPIRANAVEASDPQPEYQLMDTPQLEPRPRIPSNRTTAVSTGSETEKPIRRAENVQVAVAASSSDWSPHTALNKRKHNQPFEPASVADQKSKRRKRETPSPTNSQGPQPAHNIATSESAQQSRKENFQWKDRRKGSPSNQNWNQDSSFTHHQSSSYQDPHPATLRPAMPATNKETCQSTSQSASAGVASIVSEPDSSWPHQEKLLTSDQYMREGKRLKHEGDAFTDSRTGRTRTGESLSRALVYYEAALCFIMNGYTLELENGNDRNDSGSSHSPTSMYDQTIGLMDYIRKMRPHDENEGLAFRRLNLSCIRSQALLYLRMYRLKKDIANKYYEILNEQFKQANKSNRTPSPWHNLSGQNVVSPMSPAVPSPYGITMPGPSPIAGSTNYEPVSSSTQVSRMTSPPTSSSISVAPKLYDIIKHYHSITHSLMEAHEKWEQAEALQKEQVLSAGGTDFFRNVETLCGRTLMLHSSLRDLVTYNKVVLHQLRDIKSPHD